MKCRTQSLLLTAPAAAFAASRLYNRLQRNAGTTRAEREDPLPGDDLVPDPASVTTMAITIDASPEAVWPWLLQMGVDRAGFYTHTWVENGLFHLRVTNAGHIVPRWQDLKVGDRVWFAQASAGDRRMGPTVARIEPNRALILVHGDDPACWAGTWQFVIVPRGTGTRLLLRTRNGRHQPTGMTAFNWLFEPGYTYMNVGMLRGIRRRAERTAITTPPLEGEAPVLVAVASMQGSTREIGQAIAGELTRYGIRAEMRDAGAVDSLTGYRAVILGSAIHSHHWLREANQFAYRFRPELATMPVWLFSVGMQAADRGTWPDGSYPRDLPTLLDDTDALGHHLFLGKRQAIRPAWLMTTLSKTFRISIGDRRDWPAIRAWAQSIGEDLRARPDAGERLAA